MRGRPASRIAERQGSRGLDVLSGVWGAHSEVSSLGKSHPSQLGPAVRARRLGPMACSTSQNGWIRPVKQNDSVRGTNVSTRGFDRYRGSVSSTTLTACRYYAIMWGEGTGIERDLRLLNKLKSLPRCQYRLICSPGSGNKMAQRPSSWPCLPLPVDLGGPQPRNHSS